MFIYSGLYVPYKNPCLNALLSSFLCLKQHHLMHQAHDQNQELFQVPVLQTGYDVLLGGEELVPLVLRVKVGDSCLLLQV